MKCAIIFLLLAAPLVAQQKPSSTQNPLDKLHDQAKAVFDRAGVPFSEDQEKSIALMIEDRRQASEDLFGQLMDFRSGPVQGQQRDQAVAGIKWMNDEFRKRLREYLSEAQIPVWETYQASDGVKALEALIKELTGGDAPKQETQFIRIINNAFTAEWGWFSGQAVNTDVIQRAGVGAFHGQVEFQFRDESLNARNPFAHNRPPYQQRQTNFNFSGPVIHNKLTTSVNGTNLIREDANTVHAITPNGPFDLGITNPYTNRNFGTNGNYQISNVHSFSVGMYYENQTWKNQNVGGFNVPERGGDQHSHFHQVYFGENAVLSDKTLYRTNVNFWTASDKAIPYTQAPTIDVLGVFGGGGSPSNNSIERHGYYVNNLFSHAGAKITYRGGFDGGLRTSRSISEDNFLGTFTFSDLDSLRQGVATTYRVTRGEPELRNRQFEMSAFAENDVKFTQRLTGMFGIRYDYQTHLNDHNNAAPRVGFAYAVAKSTVIRGGTGVYYDRLWDWVYELLKRANGTQQYDIIIDNAPYPDPFKSGTVTVIPPESVRVRDPNLAAPYQVISSVSVERTFKNTLFLSGKYEFRRGIHQYRTRDLNAPLDGQLTRPDPTRGNVFNFESTATSRSQVFSLSARQRFSIFNVNANYSHYSQYNDQTGFFDTPSDNYNLRADWGRNDTPVHQFNSTVNAKLFMGVFLTSTIQANSGNFYNVTTGNDDNHDNNINDRSPGTPRNSLQGPKYLVFNFNIAKAFFIGGGGNGGAGSSGANVNFFANMNNAFNRTNYGTPSGVMTSPFFKKSYSARNAREVEVGLRFQF